MIREAQIADVPQIQVVRHTVKENTLSNPALVTNDDCIEYLTVRGKGWVYEIDDAIVGFSIADLTDNNIWALFLDPRFERRGIGRQLHDTMLDWYFSQTNQTVWLGTAPNTRAERFYTTAGWTNKGLRKNGEVRFEITADDWKKLRESASRY